MGYLFDAAIAWSNLYDTTYDMLIGAKKHRLCHLSISFYPEDFGSPLFLSAKETSRYSRGTKELSDEEKLLM